MVTVSSEGDLADSDDEDAFSLKDGDVASDPSVESDMHPLLLGSPSDSQHNFSARDLSGGPSSRPPLTVERVSPHSREGNRLSSSFRGPVHRISPEMQVWVPCEWRSGCPLLFFLLVLCVEELVWCSARGRESPPLRGVNLWGSKGFPGPSPTET